jgi:exodeoxyribonuclease-3
MARKLRIATWNINSVRLRINSVVRFLKEARPDILCLQETKCPQGQFPSAPLKEMGYGHIAEHGQKGYHGVAIVSRLPITASFTIGLGGKEDCRHIAADFEGPARIRIHNFYIPAGGDVPDPEANEKFAHKLRFLDDMEKWTGEDAHAAQSHSILVGDLNIAPLEHDVWSHKDLLKVVSHTPVETQALNRIRQSGRWTDVMRQVIPQDQKLYTWWSYRARDWKESNRGRRLDHVWASASLTPHFSGMQVFEETRGWPQPSDHVPVLAEFKF